MADRMEEKVTRCFSYHDVDWDGEIERISEAIKRGDPNAYWLSLRLKLMDRLLGGGGLYP